MNLELDFKKKIEKRDPSLKPFLCQMKSIVDTVVIPALLRFVAREATNCTFSLSDEFSLILEEDKMVYIKAIASTRKESLPNMVIQLEHYLIAFHNFRSC